MNVFQQGQAKQDIFGSRYFGLYFYPHVLFIFPIKASMPYLSPLSSLPFWILHLECEFSKTFAFLRVSLKDQTTFSLKIFMVKRLVIGRYLGAGYLTEESNFIILNLILSNLGHLFFLKNTIRELKYFIFFSFLGYYYFFQGSKVLKYHVLAQRVIASLKSSTELGC